MSAIGLLKQSGRLARPGQTEPIGLLAGSGRFPILFAEAARRQGLRVACVGIKYEASEELRGLCDSFQIVGVAKLGGMIRAFRRQGVKRIVMAGKVTKNVMYTPWRVLQLCPDLRMIQWWYRAQSRRQSRRQSLAQHHRRVRARRDDVRLGPGLLPGAARERRHTHSPRADAGRAEGHRVRLGRWPRKWAGSTSASRSPSRKRPRWPSRPSRGPTAASNAPASSAGPAAGSLVKVAKPQQDMRFDVPTIGVTTIENLHKAGARVLAIEAGKTILLDQPEVVALADRYGLSIVAIADVNGSIRRAHRCRRPAVKPARRLQSRSDGRSVRGPPAGVASRSSMPAGGPLDCGDGGGLGNARRAELAAGNARVRRRPMRRRVESLHGGSRAAAAGPAGLDGADDDLGGDLQAQACGIEHQVEVVRVVRVGAVHGAIELGAAPVEIAGGPPGRADRDAHPLGQPLGAHLQRGDDPQRERGLARQHEAGPAADQDRFARAADRLDQFGQVVEIGLLRGVILLAKRQ